MINTPEPDMRDITHYRVHIVATGTAVAYQDKVYEVVSTTTQQVVDGHFTTTLTLQEVDDEGEFLDVPAIEVMQDNPDLQDM